VVGESRWPPGSVSSLQWLSCVVWSSVSSLKDHQPFFSSTSFRPRQDIPSHLSNGQPNRVSLIDQINHRR
jgi:hypothetical protein